MSYQIASVLLTRPVDRRLDYRVPVAMKLVEGAVVTVPLGGGASIGVVYSLRHARGDNASQRPLKEIINTRQDTPALSASMRMFIDKCARYTCTSAGRVLAMVLGGHGAIGSSPVTIGLTVSGSLPDRMTSQRRRILATAAKRSLGITALARQAGVSPSTVAGLVACGALVKREIAVDTSFDPPDATRSPPYDLTPVQGEAVDRIESALDGGEFRAILLDGVTGSGKTSVYIEAIAKVLTSGSTGQILVLTPEIALAQSVAAQLGQRFATSIPLWHAEVSGSVKRRIRSEIAHGRLRIVVGARSALFLPFADLSLIVVDEEHDASYKQDDGVIYQARDLAVLRASIEKIPVILASATASLETVHNVDAGRYDRIALPDRYGAAALPEVTLTDLRASRPDPGSYLSAELIAATNTTLDAGRQVLFFLNRRGYAPLVICRSCGQRLKSPDTDSWLAEHRGSGRLVCHVTGFSMPRPRLCPHCQGEDTLVGVGPGVERIAEETHKLFPTARIEIFSSDSTREHILGPDIIARMESGQIDILIGTQIVAKGHHFPRLTLVGVIDADSGLSGVDFRASERTWQLLSQVSGRAGRADLPGRAVIQTHLPDTPVMQALVSGDRDAFVRAEMTARRQAGMPPYGRLAAVIVAARSESQVDAAAARLARATPQSALIDTFGPALAQISVLRRWHRRRFLVRAGRNADLSAYLSRWRAQARLPASVRVSLDVDPYAFT